MPGTSVHEHGIDSERLNLRRAQIRQREREMMMELVMGNMIAMRNDVIEREVELREQAMLQHAIEESKRDVGALDTDQMTYE